MARTRERRPGAQAGADCGSLRRADFAALIEPVALQLLGKPANRTKGELRYGRKGALVVALGCGIWFDHAAGQGGGVLDLVRRETGLAGRDALDWLQREVGAELASPATLERPERPPVAAPDRPLAARWLGLWAYCRPIEADCPAGRYLTARGCGLPHYEGDLRWHPQLRHPTGWTGPALVALVTDVITGEPMTLHRTWLDPDRPGAKAPIDRPRLLVRGQRKAGGCIRLWPDEEVTLGLAVGEGIETMLAASRGFSPVWALLDAGNLATCPILPGLEAIMIIADHDRPNTRTGKQAGFAAAQMLAARYVAAGFDPERSVRIWTSPVEGLDFADVAAGARVG